MEQRQLVVRNSKPLKTRKSVLKNHRKNGKAGGMLPRPAPHPLRLKSLCLIPRQPERRRRRPNLRPLVQYEIILYYRPMHIYFVLYYLYCSSSKHDDIICTSPPLLCLVVPELFGGIQRGRPASFLFDYCVLVLQSKGRKTHKDGLAEYIGVLVQKGSVVDVRPGDQCLKASFLENRQLVGQIARCCR